MTGPPRATSLQGKSVVVTRAEDQAAELNDLLRERGAIPLSYPCIAIAPPQDTGPLDAALAAAAADGFDWLVLTSANAAVILAARLKALGLAGLRLSIAAIGPATAEAVQRLLGVRVSLVPDEAVAEALADKLAPQLGAGCRLLLAQADIARPVLARRLAEAGITVTAVDAYRTVVGSGGVDLPALLARRAVDAVTFTSSSTVRNFLQRLEPEGGARTGLTGVCIACIGPVTAGTAIGLGLSACVVAMEHTVPGLVAALETYFDRGESLPQGQIWDGVVSAKPAGGSSAAGM